MYYILLFQGMKIFRYTSFIIDHVHVSIKQIEWILHIILSGQIITNNCGFLYKYLQNEGYSDGYNAQNPQRDVHQL